MKESQPMLRPEVRLPVELAALREIRRRASGLCVPCDPQRLQAKLAELREALAKLEKLEQEAASVRCKPVPPPNVHDRGE